MNKCNKCQRPLSNEEKDLCPACKSNGDYEVKKWVQIGTVAVSLLVAGFTAFTRKIAEEVTENI